MNKTLYKLNLVLFAVIVIGFLLVVLMPRNAFAANNDDDCEEVYGGGEICIINKSFEIIKKVRIEDEGKFKDKVTEVGKNDIVEFRITVKNRTDDGGVEDVSFDDMKIKDFLPKEMEKVSGDLTEEWDDFEPGEEKEFTIKARIKKSEFDRDDNFEKCVVNKVELTYKGDFEGADTATVCYGDEDKKITELPETGASSTMIMTLLGLGSITSGFFLKGYRVRLV